VKSPVYLIHDDGGLEDHTTRILPHEGLAFALTTMLLSLDYVIDSTPVHQKSIEQLRLRLPETALSLF
jgi:hypothetical protein